MPWSLYGQHNRLHNKKLSAHVVSPESVRTALAYNSEINFVQICGWNIKELAKPVTHWVFQTMQQVTCDFESCNLLLFPTR